MSNASNDKFVVPPDTIIKADLIDANLWLKINDCEPIVPAPTDIAEY